MAELLPCPFCGGEARIIVVEKGVHSIIQCTTCYCGFMRHSFNNGDTDEHAALRLTTAWNTRTPKERDVQEVRHGHWITKDLDNFRKIECKCSECGYIGISNYDSYDDPYDFNYCPNCGAKMDGKEDEAENKEVEK